MEGHRPLIRMTSSKVFTLNGLAMTLDFTGRVAIVTGAGGGLGREHALALAKRGAKVVVNDLDHQDGRPSAAQSVVDEIKAAGGEAMAIAGSVTDFAAMQAMVQQTQDTWGRVDILINNAGILRDKSFTKMDLDDFRLVMDVHLMGAAHCTKAVWPLMVAQKFGRIVMTTSSSGLFGNFGQSNYGAAKMALVGLMQTLSIEGEKSNIRVNCLAPTAATQMTEGVLPPQMLELLQPEAVTPAMLVLAHETAPNRTILCAGAGTFASAQITLTQGLHLGLSEDVAERLAEQLAVVTSPDASCVPRSGAEQGQQEINLALAAGPQASTD
jgi:NAD(P)-dependent dehydrogenase (short-subunit alcohol dehydrogenase family)